SCAASVHCVPGISKRRSSAGEKMLRVQLEDKTQGNKAQVASIRRDKNRWSQHGKQHIP
ncbi:hypothetical protein A2U01_0084901, partial [Trifolium medium]|nr:hypothetical protein [Trifolium medium]